MSSSNPFRKKAAAPESRFPALDDIDTTSRAQPPPSKTSMRPPELPAVDGKPKPVKKVRVLSPPPLSPDSPEWPYNAPPPPGVHLDPFGGASEDSDRDSMATPPPPAAQGLGIAMPPNPFSKTLHDLEGAKKEEELEKQTQEEGAVLKAANAARGSLNVDAFHRLLMTGDAGTGPSTQGVPGLGEEASVDTPTTAKLEAVNAAHYAAVEQDIRHTPNEAPDVGEEDESLSDSSVNVQIGSRGKKAPPPPPSSRHGKSLRTDETTDNTLSNTSSSSDINKPLPLAPVRNSIDDDADSPFDREAAGKVPEPDAAAISQVAPPISAKKPVPAPPPRRGHARTESKHPASAQTHDDEGSFQSSQEPSTLSRSESVRQATQAPAPPPPRRPHAGAWPVPSPTGASFNMTSSPAPSVHHPDTEQPPVSDHPLRDAQSVKMSAPPPPPARNASIRRPASVISVEAPSRRISSEAKPREGIAPPPPPPPRQRGSSRSSVEGPPRRTSVDSMGKLRPVPGDGAADEVGSSADILADLTALQREVDALRGKIN